MSAFIVAGNSSAATSDAPQNVHLTEYYVSGGNHQIGVASPSTVTAIYYAGGGMVSSQVSNNPTFSLIPGNYRIAVSPSYANPTGAYVVSYGNSSALEVSSSTTVQVNINATPTSLVHVTLNGFQSGTSAKVTFTTTTGFSFLTNTTTNGSFYAYLPSGQFYATVDYSASKYNYLENLAPSATSLILPVSGSDSIFGFVSPPSGQTISGFSISVINTSSNTYSVNNFTGDSYTLFLKNLTNKFITLSAPGYKPVTLNSAPGAEQTVNLVPASSGVYLNYSFSSNLQHLSYDGAFVIDNSTTIPWLPNSTVGSLYWQMKLDSSFNSHFLAYVNSSIQPYTNSSIFLNGYNYKLNVTNGSVLKSATKNSTLVTFSSNYSNSSVPVKYSGMDIKLYDQGTATTPGALGFNYNITYKNNTTALQSSTVQTITGISPILIGPQATSQWIDLKFSSVKNPTLVNSYITFNWKGLNSTNYVVNKSQKNTVFVAPVNTNVTINVSKAFFNPVTGTNDYSKANFTWTVNGTLKQYGPQVIVNFHNTLMNTIEINVTSLSGGTNSTNITVYAVSVTPTVNYNVSYNGVVKKNGTSVANGSVETMTLLQGDTYAFSAYNSSATIPGTSYRIPLLYQWKFTNFTSTSSNTTYSFSKPGTSNGTLVVSTITEQNSTVKFNVQVNDTTPPNARITLTNATGKKLVNPLAGAMVVLSANASTDPYNQSLTYNWTIQYANGTRAANGTIYTVVSGNLSKSAVIKVRFITLNDVKVSLNVTNHPANVSAYKNVTYTIVVSSPRIVVNSVKFTSTPTQGQANTFNVTVSNQGTENAKSFNLTVVAGGSTFTRFYNQSLNVSQNETVHFEWTPSSSGNVSVQVSGNATGEPAFFSSVGSLSTYVTVKPPSYETPLIIGVVIAVIVVVGFAYYRFSSKGIRRGRDGAQKPKTSLLEKKSQQEKGTEGKDKK